MDVIFHLGMPKTGTSILQNSVHLAAKAGAIPTVLYPKFGRGNAIAHHNLASLVLKCGNEGESQALASELGKKLEEERSQGANVAFISSEGFTNSCGAGSCTKLVDFAPVTRGSSNRKFVLLFRDIPSFLESMYLQSSRFGNISMNFGSYLISRKKWIQNIFLGVSQLKNTYGSEFIIEPYVRNFDVISYFEDLLDVDSGSLREQSKLVPSTAKHTLKQQAFLSHLPEMSSLVGYEIDRQRCIRQFDKANIFLDDTTEYTLYDEDSERTLRDETLVLAEASGLNFYVDSFSNLSFSNKPRREISLETLDGDDLEQVKLFRGALEAR